MKFNDCFTAIPRLETERLVLRAFTREDIAAYLAIIHDSRVQRFLGGGVPVLSGEPHITNWLNNVNGRLLKSRTVFTWCIEQKSDSTVVGRIDLGGFVRKSMADISYYLAPSAWGRGLATEAVGAVTRFGLDTLKLHRIQAMVMPDNAASIRVLEKAGYSMEGHLRKYQMGKEFHDVDILAIVDEGNLQTKA
ncbi:MAG TPA: GNAT family protein [Candidatus Limiplasma sp.]|nr:GNAT family protein [Candidatus Limiplasma sp.]HRX08766.1 GNAT family protein [Candidatus Limiplasma sp.]